MTIFYSKLAALTCWMAALSAMPQGMSVHKGNCVVQENGLQMTIRAEDQTVLNWTDFSIGRDESLNLVLPHPRAAMIHRVTEMNPSQIEGCLFSNGRVILINPAGIWMSPESKIETAGFVASTLDLFGDFAKQTRIRLTGNNSGDIKAEGQIIAREGNIVLIADSISQKGTIQALNGQAALLGMKECYLSLDNLEWLDEECVLANNVQVDGLIQAQKIPSQGGTIQIHGNQIQIGSDAILNADGETLGGTISVGRTDSLQAKYVYTHPSSLITASAIKEGNGGTVTLYGQQRGQVYGSIAARGGKFGCGGFIEASSDFIDFQGTVDTRAEQGSTGMFLLDPLDIELTAVLDMNVSAGPIFQPTASPSSISEVTLNAALGASNVTVQSLGGAGPDAGNIYTVTDIALTPVAPNTLTLLSFNNIYINAEISVGTAGSLSLQAPSGSILVGNAPTPSLQTRNAGLYVADGTLTLAAANSIIVDASSNFSAFVAAQIGTVNCNAGLDIVLIGGSAAGNFAQIGLPTNLGTPLNGNISASAIGAIVLNAGSGDNCYAQMGHGTSNVYVPGTLQGNIDVSGENILLNGGSGTGSYAVIGHHGPNDSVATLNLSGAINVSTPGSIVLSAGTADSTDAIIGHIAEAYNNATIDGSLTCSVGGTVRLNGGSSRSEACIGVIGENFLGEMGDLNINFPLVSIAINGFGTSILDPGISADSGAVLGGRINSASATSSLTVADFHLTSNGSISILPSGANSPGIIGFIGASTNVMSVNLDVQIAGDLTIDNNGGNGINGVSSSVIFGSANDTNATFYLSARNLIASSIGGGGIFISSGGPMQIDIANDLSIQSDFIGIVLCERDITINAGNDIQLTGATPNVFPPVSFFSTGGAISVTAGNDIVMQGVAGPGTYSTGILSQGVFPVTVIAGSDMLLGNGTAISSQSDIILVVDNLFPSPPLIGSGSLVLEPETLILSGGKRTAQFFTARQNQNSIQGTVISGAITQIGFTPGPLFGNIPPELWGVYYPDPFFYAGQAFTIFYKESIQQVLAQATLVIDQVLVDLHPYNEFPGWMKQFSLSNSTSENDLLAPEIYYLRCRQLNAINHPKSYTELID